MLLSAMATLAVLGCETEQAGAGGSLSAPLQNQAPQQLPKPDAKAVELFVSYLKARNGALSAVPPIDKRPPQEIAADLRALPKEQRLGLRAYTLEHPYLAWEALDLLGQLLPEGHREFLLQSLEAKGWASYAIPRLVALDDPSVVGPILVRAEPVGVRGLKLLAPLAIPPLLDAVRQQHSVDPTALLVAHHLAGYDRPVPGKEHPLLKPLLQATHDSDVEVRREAAQQIARYAHDGHYPEGRKALRRLVEMMRDPSPRVRGESAVQASQYPSPEVLALLKKMAADNGQDPKVRESARRAAEGLEERLLKPMGRKPVTLGGGA